MRICLLTTQELDADPFPDDDWPCDPRPYFPEADWHLEVLERETAVQRVIQLAAEGFDLFFNLCDGAFDEPHPGIEVVQALERLDVPFAGATSGFYEPTREAMKHACQSRGLDYPAYVMARSEEDVERAAQQLRFPMIVKHPNSYASIDLTEKSRVTTPAQLRTQAFEMITKHTGALIEEFIEGTECTVLVVENSSDPQEPIAYTPVQYEFPDGQTFKHYDMKWVDYDDMKCELVADPDFADRLRDASKQLFVALDGAGFGRVDMRVDAEGRIFILEINPNCGVYYPPTDPGGADLCLLHDPAGHEGFTRHLIDAAFARHARRVEPWRLLPSEIEGFGVFATRSIEPGERIVSMSTRGRLRLVGSPGTSGGELEEWERRSAWPLGEDLYLAWSSNPEQWCPINHSCDPSAWVEGLDVVARRRVEPGAEVTLDYATVFAEAMPAFTCECGVAECRGVVTGTDHKEPFVDRYEGHVTPYIAGVRAASVYATARGAKR